MQGDPANRPPQMSDMIQRSQMTRMDGSSLGDRTGPVLFIPALLAVVTGLVSCWSVFAGSTSTDPAVFGRYSIALAAVVMGGAALVTTLMVSLLVAPGRFLDRIRRVLNRAGGTVIPEFAVFAGLPLLALAAWIGPHFTPLASEGRILWGAASMLAGLAIASVSACPSGRWILFGKRSFLFVFTLLLVVALLEVGMRIVSPGSVFHASFDLRPHVRVTLESDLPGVMSGGTYSTNRWGMRGEEPPEDWDSWTTVICVGGSTTQCFELDDSRTWPALLQRNLRDSEPRTWVGNGGLGGHGTRGHLVFMDEVIDVTRPDIALFLVGANEMVIYNGMGPGRQANLGTFQPNLGWWLFCNSRIVQIAYSLKKSVIDEVPVQGTDWAQGFNSIPFEGPEAPTPDDLHELMVDPDFTRNNVRELIEKARAMGVTPVFLTQPLAFDDTEYWRGIFGDFLWKIEEPDHILSAATVWRMLDTLNQDVLDVCAEEGVACYDLASAVPHDLSYFYDGTHLNDAGAALVADSVAAFMIREGLVGR